MALGIGAGGILGLAPEVTAGTYVAPTKFVPILSESVAWQQETVWRRPIRGVADVLGAVASNGHVEGDIEIEILDDTFAHFMHAMRNTVAKTGVGPYVYTFTPAHGAEATPKTLSLTIVRNGAVFGYTGCVVQSLEATVDNGLLKATLGILGRSEAVQASPTPAWPTTTPYGADTYVIEVPVATPVTDTTEWTFSVEDNGEPQYRLGSLAAQKIAFGERNATMQVTRDFQDRTEYDLFKARTATSILMKATKSASQYVSFKLPSVVRDTYEVALSGQGDLLAAQVNFQGVYDTATSKVYEIIVATTENIT